MKREPVWYVLIADFNAQKIKAINIMEHHCFREEIEELLNNPNIEKEDFAKEVEKSAFHYFWGKCEYEMIVDSVPQLAIDRKIDVYEQLQLNWDVFINCLWSLKE